MTSVSPSRISTRGIPDWRLTLSRVIHPFGYHSLLAGVHKDEGGNFTASAWCFVCGIDVPALAPTYAEAKAIADSWRAEDAALLLAAARARRRGGPRAKRTRGR